MKRENLGRTIRELGIIVVGVLLALWIDASWAWLQDRNEEAYLVEDLSSDFGANLTELDRVIEAHERASIDIGRLLHGSIADLPEDSVLVFLASITQVHTFNARDGALMSALSSGRIELLRDRQLRAALTRWPGYLSDATESSDWIIPTVMDLGAHFAPDLYALEYVPTEALVSSARALVEEMATEPTFRANLALRAVLWGVEVDEVWALREETAKIVTLLKSR